LQLVSLPQLRPKPSLHSAIPDSSSRATEIASDSQSGPVPWSLPKPAPIPRLGSVPHLWPEPSAISQSSSLPSAAKLVTKSSAALRTPQPAFRPSASFASLLSSSLLPSRLRVIGFYGYLAGARLAAALTPSSAPADSRICNWSSNALRVGLQPLGGRSRLAAANLPFGCVSRLSRVLFPDRLPDSHLRRTGDVPHASDPLAIRIPSWVEP